jgi:hypothetical protein
MSTKPFKLARNVLGGVTINDILSTALGRAIWRYMAENSSNQYDSMTQSCIRNTTRIPVDDDPHDVLKSFTLSEGVIKAFWGKVPGKLHNNVGFCRVGVPRPVHLQNKGLKECRATIIKDVLAKREAVKLQTKGLNLGLTVKFLCDLLPNTIPSFLFNHFMRPRKVTTYIMSNPGAFPVTMEFLGLPMDRPLPVPPPMNQVVGKYSNQ